MSDRETMAVGKRVGNARTFWHRWGADRGPSLSGCSPPPYRGDMQGPAGGEGLFALGLRTQDKKGFRPALPRIGIGSSLIMGPYFLGLTVPWWRGEEGEHFWRWPCQGPAAQSLGRRQGTCLGEQWGGRPETLPLGNISGSVEFSCDHLPTLRLLQRVRQTEMHIVPKNGRCTPSSSWDMALLVVPGRTSGAGAANRRQGTWLGEHWAVARRPSPWKHQLLQREKAKIWDVNC